MTAPISVTVSGDPGTRLHAQQAYDEAIAHQVPQALERRDPTIWGPEAESEAAIRLGWLDVDRTSRPLVAELERLRAELRAEGVDQVVLCGMGGSSLAPEVICKTAGVPLTVLDSTHPDQVAAALAGDLARTVVVVSSKSGGTVETDSHRRVFAAAFAAAGIDPKRRIVVVTDPGSPFEKLGHDEGYRAVFLADPHIGGRYSALSAFGLVPSALAGVDVGTLLDEAALLLDTLQGDSPALVLAGALGGLGAAGRDKVALDADGYDLPGFGDWAEQLIAESTGKLGKGLLPVVVEPGAPELDPLLPDVHHVRIGPVQVAEGTTMTGTLGAAFVAWEYAVAIAGRTLGINPFDQPDVESAKKAARGLLDAQPAAEEPAFVDGAVEVRATDGLLGDASTVEEAVSALLATLEPSGYLAVMAYLDRLRDASLAGVRSALARRTGRPVTFGWGPRFLHSTGQFHKGGPAVGSFLQISGAHTRDVEIPDAPFTFGVLIDAQATGDAGVLADHGRPVLRLHVTDLSGLAQVATALGAA